MVHNPPIQNWLPAKKIKEIYKYLLEIEKRIFIHVLNNTSDVRFAYTNFNK
uniref:Uncharacterized protein n=1 Tax=Rhizophora mucronata TaxID=61149 RepID=A0A2P2NJ36_RHIMU